MQNEEKTNFDRYLEDQLKDPSFASRFERAGERLKKEFYQLQGYWSRKAKEKGILGEKELERYLKK